MNPAASLARSLKRNQSRRQPPERCPLYRSRHPRRQTPGRAQRPAPRPHRPNRRSSRRRSRRLPKALRPVPRRAQAQGSPRNQGRPNHRRHLLTLESHPGRGKQSLLSERSGAARRLSHGPPHPLRPRPSQRARRPWRVDGSPQSLRAAPQPHPPAGQNGFEAAPAKARRSGRGGAQKPPLTSVSSGKH